MNRKLVNKKSRSESIEMVYARGMNGLVPYGQKGVDGQSWWGGGYEGDCGVKVVAFGPRCEGGLGQQRNDDGGCMTMHERLERVESPGTYVTE